MALNAFAPVIDIHIPIVRKQEDSPLVRLQLSCSDDPGFGRGYVLALHCIARLIDDAT